MGFRPPALAFGGSATYYPLVFKLFVFLSLVMFFFKAYFHQMVFPETTLLVCCCWVTRGRILLLDFSQ